MELNARMVGGLLKRTWTAYFEDNALRLASSIAFATIFAIAPLLIVIIALAGALLGPANGGDAQRIAEDAVLAQIRAAAGDGAAQTVRDLMASTAAQPQQGVLAQWIGLGTFLFGASALFGALQDALNSVWHVEGPKGGWKHIVRARLAASGMVAVGGFLLVASLVATSATTAIAVHFTAIVPFSGGATVLTLLSWLFAFGTITVAFALVYKVLPDVALQWSDVWHGAAITAALFLVGQVLIGIYFTLAAVGSGYGAAGSILAALTWIYYSAGIMLFGAEFTKVRAGDVRTTVPALIRELVDRPAGIDPRRPWKSPAQGSARD
jgi:membrane protein